MPTCMQGLTSLVRISFSAGNARLMYAVNIGTFPTIAKQKVWTMVFDQAMELLDERLKETGTPDITYEVVQDPSLFVRPGMSVVDIKPGDLIGDFERFYAAVKTLS